MVKAGTPGISNSKIGDISVKGDGNTFYNGGEMWYGWPPNFPTDMTLGIFVPLECFGYYENSTVLTEPNSVQNDPILSHPFEGIPLDQHQPLIDHIAVATQAIASIRESEMQRTGMDPLAIELLPQLALYN